MLDRRPARGELVLPWPRTFEMCWKNIRIRLGRFALVFLSLAVVVAFFVSTLTVHGIVNALRGSTDVHTRAVLERAGVLSHHPDAEKTERDQMIWMLALSGMLCFAVVVNTMLMSVTERYREIGTLKCLGAMDRFVVRLFLVESIFVGLVASVFGTLLGFLLSVVQLAVTLELSFLADRATVETLAIATPLGIAGGTLLTVLASVYPTWKAARMRPVDAMRTEI